MCVCVAADMMIPHSVFTTLKENIVVSSSFLFVLCFVCLCAFIYVCAQKGYGEVSLVDCMQLFTKEDVLDGDEKPVRRFLFQ